MLFPFVSLHFSRLQAVQTEKHLMLDCQAPPMRASCVLPTPDLFSPKHTSSLKAFLNDQSPQRVANFTRDMLTLLVGTWMARLQEQVSMLTELNWDTRCFDPKKGTYLVVVQSAV